MAYEVAKYTGVFYQTTNQLAKNARPPSQRTKNLISAWLSVSPEELIKGVVFPQSRSRPPKDWKQKLLRKLKEMLPRNDLQAVECALEQIEKDTFKIDCSFFKNKNLSFLTLCIKKKTSLYICEWKKFHLTSS